MGIEFLKLFKRYHPSQHLWEFVSPLNHARWGHTKAVTVGDSLYVLGGAKTLHLEMSIRKSIERYDPSTDTWEIVGQLPTRRTYFETAVVGKAIYIIGGKDSNNKPTNMVQIFNTESKVWTTGTPIPGVFKIESDAIKTAASFARCEG